MLDVLGDFVHRFIPGRKLAEGQVPDVDDIVLFLHKEAQRSRNCKYKFGRVIQTDIDGRKNKIKIRYRNASEVISREVERSVKDVVLIHGTNEIDFNTQEHYLAAEIQSRYLCLKNSMM